ncbi:MAG: type II secretion system protein GspM [Burkholderiaceae bacterium]
MTVFTRLAGWWRECSQREQHLLCAAGALLLGLLLWLWIIQPAVHTLQKAHTELPRLRAQSAQVNAIIAETQRLAGQGSARLPPAQLTPALQNSLERAQLPAQLVSSPESAQEHVSREWTVQLDNAPAEPVFNWLAGLPEQLHLRAASVDLRRSNNADGSDRPGYITGRLVLQPLQDNRP